MAAIPVTNTTETERALGAHSVAGSLAFAVAVIALMQTMSIPLLPVMALARVVGSVLAAAIVTIVMATGSTLVVGVARPDEWTFVFACVVGALPAVAVGLLVRRAGPGGQAR